MTRTPRRNNIIEFVAGAEKVYKRVKRDAIAAERAGEVNRAAALREKQWRIMEKMEDAGITDRRSKEGY